MPSQAHRGKAPPLDQLWLGDCLEKMRDLPKHSIDVVFADPPYNLQLRHDLWRPDLSHVDPVDDDWDQFANFASYDAFTKTWLKEVRRTMKGHATIWVSGTYHNIFRIGAIMQDLGFWLLNTVTWYRPNAMPNFRGARLKNDVEFIIWAKRSETSRHPYNHQFMKQFNDGKQLGSVWEIPTCVGKERLRDEKGKKLHPTQKPEELLKRILLASSQPGNLVLDPFVGTGTTAAVAKRLHRHWIGIEQEEVYYRAAQKRLARVAPLPLDNEFLQPLSPIKHKRLPFRKLLEYEILRAGQTLYLDDPACSAVILENGWLQSNGYSGSIHKMACLLKEVPTCNGWVHWHYRDEETGDYAPIDMLRQQVRRQLLPRNKEIQENRENLRGNPFE